MLVYQGASIAEARMMYSGCPTLVTLGFFALVGMSRLGRSMQMTYVEFSSEPFSTPYEILYILSIFF